MVTPAAKMGVLVKTCQLLFNALNLGRARNSTSRPGESTSVFTPLAPLPSLPSPYSLTHLLRTVAHSLTYLLHDTSTGTVLTARACHAARARVHLQVPMTFYRS